MSSPTGYTGVLFTDGLKDLKTGLVPSASGSAYLELESSSAPANKDSLIPSSSALKLTCSVHGPRPLPRSSPFTPHILLTTHIKFAPFASRQRRGYVRDASERDLAVHLQTALRGVIIGDRSPKSGVDVVITVLEGEEDHWYGDARGKPDIGSANGQASTGWGMMTVLAGCITVASAAIVDAGIDCVDLVAGGVAAVVSESYDDDPTQTTIVLDPSPTEHRKIHAACVVGYLAARDEVTELWIQGGIPSSGLDTEDPPKIEQLIDDAVRAASGARKVLSQAVKEATLVKFGPDAQSATAAEVEGDHTMS